MKWFLAGLAFALLIALAVFTVAIRTQNLAARARIAAHNEQIESLRVERARSANRSRGRERTAELIDRLMQYHGIGPAH